jgi:hypothetical protein
MKRSVKLLVAVQRAELAFLRRECRRRNVEFPARDPWALEDILCECAVKGVRAMMRNVAASAAQESPMRKAIKSSMDYKAVRP